MERDFNVNRHSGQRLHAAPTQCRQFGIIVMHCVFGVMERGFHACKQGLLGVCGLLCLRLRRCNLRISEIDRGVQAGLAAVLERLADWGSSSCMLCFLYLSYENCHNDLAARLQQTKIRLSLILDIFILFGIWQRLTSKWWSQIKIVMDNEEVLTRARCHVYRIYRLCSNHDRYHILLTRLEFYLRLFERMDHRQRVTSINQKNLTNVIFKKITVDTHAENIASSRRF